MRRREFLGCLAAGAAAARPLAATAQQSERVRRIGALMNFAVNDPEGQARIAAFQQALQKLGWIENRNMRLDIRWGAGDDAQVRRHAAELVMLSPDVILAAGGSVLGPLLQATRTVPIVFAQVIDPVGSGYVNNLSQPGGNTTGFTNFDFTLSGKLVELLKEVSPTITRVALIRNPTVTQGIGQFAAIQVAAASLKINLHPLDIRSVSDIERGLATFAGEPNSGLIVIQGATGVYSETIIALAARYRLPAVHPFRYFVRNGGLMSYGPDTVDPFRRAADYVDRILKGDKPADLPIQAPTKYELAINLKTAKALGLIVPPSLIARADDVIE